MKAARERRWWSCGSKGLGHGFSHVLTVLQVRAGAEAWSRGASLDQQFSWDRGHSPLDFCANSEGVVKGNFVCCEVTAGCEPKQYSVLFHGTKFMFDLTARLARPSAPAWIEGMEKRRRVIRSPCW